jgi:carboxymethylenebutenolidase
MLAACRAGDGKAEDGAPGKLAEDMVQIATPDGTADAFFVRPAKGTHPGVLMWPDIAGLREASKEMGRRLAAQGFAVLVVNQYYRSAAAPVLETLAEYFKPEGQAKIKPMREAITPERTTIDAKAFVRWLDSRDEVAKAARIGTVGYCMGGPFAVRTAAAVPDRVRAAVSMHGAALVTGQPGSPHRLLKDSKASFLFAIGRNDDAKAPGDKDALRLAASEAGRAAEVEVYPADHGWTALDAPVYDKEQADRANARMVALFRSAL